MSVRVRLGIQEQHAGQVKAPLSLNHPNKGRDRQSRQQEQKVGFFTGEQRHRQVKNGQGPGERGGREPELWHCLTETQSSSVLWWALSVFVLLVADFSCCTFVWYFLVSHFTCCAFCTLNFCTFCSAGICHSGFYPSPFAENIIVVTVDDFRCNKRISLV